MPPREFCVHRVKPSIDTSFTGVDFLSAANETDDHGPVFVAIHARNQEFWFRHAQTQRGSSFGCIKLAVCSQIPCALRLVKNDDMLGRWIRICQCFISKMMYVLDERLNAFTNLPLPDLFALGLLAFDLVTCKRLPQNRNERTSSPERKTACVG